MIWQDLLVVQVNLFVVWMDLIPLKGVPLLEVDDNKLNPYSTANKTCTAGVA